MRLAGFVAAVSAVGFSCAIAACDSSTTSVTPTHNHGTSAHSASGAAVGGDPAIGPQLAAVREATAVYHDVANAHAAGYSTANEPCVASPAGTMGVHAPNQALIQNPALDPLRPEVLLFEPKPNGGLKLVAVEYLKIVPLRHRVTGAVGPYVSPNPWDPAVYEVAVPTPQLFGQAFDGPMAGHAPTMPWHWDLHVWIWTPNPSGMFTQWNPSVHCN
jgi:hypothetical protein